MEKGAKVFVASDHAGFETKEKIRRYLDEKKMGYKDFTPVKKKGDDYPGYAFKVAKAVAKTRGGKGILVCGSGLGMEIAANKVKGARAVEVYDDYTAKMSRKDNDANIISFRERGVPGKKAIKLLNTWLNTKFSGAKRHKRRIKEIAKYEK